MSDQELKLKITADGKVAIQELENLERAIGKVGPAGTSSFRALTAEITGAASASALLGKGLAAAGAALSVGAVAAAAKEYARAAVEMDRLKSIMEAGAGSANQVGRANDFVTQTARTMGLEFTNAATAYGKLAASARGTALQGQATQAVFSAVARASSALALSAEDTNGVLLALSQMMGKGKVQAEELRGQLGERLPGAFQIAARAMGVTTAQLDDMLEKGQLVTDDFLPKFAAELDKTFSGARFDRAGQEINRLTNEWEKFKQSFVNTSFVADAARQVADGVRRINESLRPGSGLLPSPLKGGVDPYGLSDPATRQQLKGSAAPGTLALEVPGRISDLTGLMKKTAETYGVALELVQAVAQVESGAKMKRPDGSYVISSAGAIGAMQLMPGTAARYKVDPYSSAGNIEGGVRYLADLLKRYGSSQEGMVKAIAAYNAGEGNVDKYGIDTVLSGRFAKGQTRDYVKKVLGNMKADPMAAMIDLDEYGNRLKKSEAMFNATLAKNLAGAESAAKLVSAQQASMLAGLDKEMADRAKQRGASLDGKTGAELRAQELENEKAALADAQEYAKRRSDIETKSLAAAADAQRARIDGLQQERAGMASRLADAAELASQDAKIAAAQNELAVLAEQRRQAETKASTDIVAATTKEAEAAQRLKAEREAGLLALSESAKKTQAILSAAQKAQGMGGDAQFVQQEIQAAERRLDLEQQIRDVRIQYAGDKAAQDQAEAYLREQAKAAQDLERLTRDSTDRQTAYWTGAWEQAGRNMHDALAGLFESMLTGQSSSLQAMVGQLSKTTARLAANSAAGALETVGGEAWKWIKDAVGMGASAAPATEAAARAAQSANGIDPITGYNKNALPGAAGSFDSKWGNAAASLAAPVAGAIAQSLTVSTNYAPWMADKTTLAVQGGIADIADAIGNLGGWFALAKAIRPIMGLQNRLFQSVGGGDRKLTSSSIPFFMTGTPLGPLLAAWTAPIVKSGAGFNWQDGRGLQLAGQYAQNGAPVDALVGGGAALSRGLLKAEDILGVSLGNFFVEARNRGDRFWLNAYDAKGNPTTQIGGDRGIRLTEENLKGQLGLLTTALLKRGEVLKQFDDLMMRSAIKAGQDLSQISENMNSVYKLRVFEGDSTDLSAQLTKQRSQYMDRQRLIQDYSGGVREGMELYKLDVAYQRQFAAQVGAYQSALSQLAGGSGSTVAEAIRQVDDAARQLRAQNKELEDAAKRSKGKLTYTPVTEQEIETARQAALARVQTEFLASLRQLSGATVPLSVQIVDLVTQFKALTSEAKTAGVAASTVGATLAAQFGGLILSTTGPLLGERSNIAALKARITGADTTGAALADAERALANNTNREAELSLIGQVRQAIESRYGAELSRLQALEAAYQRIADYAKGLRLGGLSTLTPAARFNAARSDYAAMLAKAKSGDADALAGLSGSADTYLQQAQGYYASGSAYQAIFKRVYGDLGALGAKAGGAGNDIASLQASTVAKLDGLDGRIGSALDYAKAQLQAGLDTVGALGVLNDTQTKALSELIAMTGQQGVSNLALGALVANLQGQAAAATGSGAITGIGTGGPTTAGQTQSAGFQAAFESARKSNGFNVTDAKRLERWLNANLTGQGYNAEDWALWRAVGQTIEGYSQQMSASGKAGHSAQAHRIAAGINSKLPDDMRFFAVGGLARGWAMVGERGPELVNFTDPGRVYTASQTAAAINQAQGGDGAGRLAEAIEKLGKILEASNGKTAGVLRGELGRILEAILMGHGVQAETADKIAREVRMGLAKRAA